MISLIFTLDLLFRHYITLYWGNKNMRREIHTDFWFRKMPLFLSQSKNWSVLDQIFRICAVPEKYWLRYWSMTSIHGINFCSEIEKSHFADFKICICFFSHNFTVKCKRFFKSFKRQHLLKTRNSTVVSKAISLIVSKQYEGLIFKLLQKVCTVHISYSQEHGLPKGFTRENI